VNDAPGITGLGRRILVVGPPCAGKSTLAARLARAISAPHVELDALHWEPGWTPASRETFLARVREATAGDSWVVDGNYTEAQQVFWERVTGVVWLDLPLGTVIPRILRRAWRRWRSREVLWNTNRETFLKHFRPGDDSLVWWALKTHRRRRDRYERLMRGGSPEGARWVRVRSAGAVEAWAEQNLS